MPKISIIIPVYNRSKVIRNTLDAIAVQTFKDWECLLVDDLSTDDSWDILIEYTRKDSRFLALKNVFRKGACGARNTGFKHAKGEYLQFFDSDDKMYPTLLEDLYSKFSGKINVVTCWTNVVDIGSNKIIDSFEYVSTGNIHKELLTGKTYVDTNCAMIKRDLVNTIGGWSEDCPSFQEWDFHIRLSKHANYSTFKKHLINYYVGGTDTISKSQYRWFIGMLYILSKYKKDWFILCPYNYLKRIYGFYCQLQNFVEDENYSKIVVQYNHEVNCFFRIVVLLIYSLKKR